MMLFILAVIYELGAAAYSCHLLVNEDVDINGAKDFARIYLAVMLWPWYLATSLFQPATQLLLPDIGETA